MTQEDATTLIAQHKSDCPGSDARRLWTASRWWLPGKWMVTATDPAGKEWVVKFGIDHGGRAPETCRREHLLSLLGRATRVSVVDAWVIPSDEFVHHVQPLHPQGIRDHAVLMPRLMGQPVQQVKETARAVAIRDPVTLGDIFAFMHWVGDEDRSLTDVMLVNGRFVLIDNGLCGPGLAPRIRSYHPMPDTCSDRITLKCYGGGKHALVEFILSDARLPPQSLSESPAIGRIEALTDLAVDAFVREAGIEAWVANTLNARKRVLRLEYPEWLERAVAVCRRLSTA